MCINMVSYATIRTAILAGWTLAPGQPIPSIYDKTLRYSTTYPNVLFLKMYKDMPMKEISLNGKVSQQQIFTTTGVYATYELAQTALLEVKRILTAITGVRITGKGNVVNSDKRYVFQLPAFELSFF